MRIVGNIIKWLGFGVYAACAVLVVVFLTPIGGWKALDVLTGSMRPAIQPGTLVLIHKVPLGSIKPDNIVTYTNPHNFKQTITHRVIKIVKVNGTTTVTVKGDANPAPDPPFPGGLIDGRVAVIIPSAGRYINWLHNPYGLAALVIIPGLIVIWTEIRRLRRALAEPKPPAHSDDPPPPPAPGTPPTPARPAVAAANAPPTPPSQSTRPRRSLDGMRHLMVLGLTLMVVSLAVGHTYAATVGKVSLTGNRFTTIAAAQSLCPPGSTTITHTGPGSVTTITCQSSANTSTTTVTTTTVTNTNQQTSTTGNSTSTSGNATMIVIPRPSPPPAINKIPK